MLLQVKVVHPTRSRPVPFGPVVSDLGEARIVVKVLDWLYKVKQLPAPSVSFYTPEHEVIAVEPDGTGWSYKDQDPSGHSDGIWDRL